MYITYNAFCSIFSISIAPMRSCGISLVNYISIFKLFIVLSMSEYNLYFVALNSFSSQYQCKKSKSVCK
jgi:hypothetical protein